MRGILLGVGERKSFQDLLDSGRRLGKAEMRSISSFSLGSYFVRTYDSPLLLKTKQKPRVKLGAFAWCWE